MRLVNLGVVFALGGSVIGGCAASEETDEGTEPRDAGGKSEPAQTDSSTPFGVQGKDGGVEIEVPVTDAGVDAGPAPTFSVSGQIKVGDTVFRDSDVKNVDSLYIPNDSIDVSDPDQDQAQEISSPSTVAGYLGLIDTVDADDNKITIKDNVDYYRVTLAEGQTVTLFTSEPFEDSDGNKAPLADLDLLLLDKDNADISEGGAWVDDSMGIGDKEQVTAPRTDTYWIAVERYQDDEDAADDSDQALYSLAVGIRQTGATMQDIAATKLSTQWAAVPGEALMRSSFGPQSASLAREVSHITYGQNAIGYAHVSLNSVAAASTARGKQDPRTTIRALKRLRKQGADVTPNYIYQHMGIPAPNDPLLGSQWHYDQISLSAAWAQTDTTLGAKRGEGVVVAVLDTGVAMSHPDFKNTDDSSQLTTDGYDMIANEDVGVDGDGRDDNPDDPGDNRVSGSSSFHGTHCAGTIAAATNNGEGAAGIAPNAKVMPIRVLGRGGGSLSDILEGLLYAAGLDNETGEKPAKKADIISMSLGGPGRNPAMAMAIAAVRAEGVIVIGAAGNANAPAEIFSPGGEEGVVTVSATDFGKKRAFYSNFGSAIDIAAPGGDTGADENLDGQPDGVVSLVFKNGGATKYAAYQGTSMSCPHVAGVAALMKSIWKDMSPGDFDAALGSIVEDIGASDDFGQGLINANKAVSFALEQAGETVELQPVLSVSSTVLDYGGSVDSLPIALGNAGKGDLVVNNVSSPAGWVDTTDVKVGPGTIVVDRDAAELVAGVNSTTITIATNGGTKDISIRVFKGTQPDGGDIDILYVMMVDPTTGVALRQVPAFREEDGFLPDYGFEITDVPAGKYYLVAGSDMADTFFLGNDGDAYGAFPVSQDPQLICRLLAEPDPECPQLSPEALEQQAEDPDLTGAVVPIQLLVDLGAVEVDDTKTEAAAFSAASTPHRRPFRVKRLR